MKKEKYSDDIILILIVVCFLCIGLYVIFSCLFGNTFDYQTGLLLSCLSIMFCFIMISIATASRRIIDYIDYIFKEIQDKITIQNDYKQEDKGSNKKQ
jgi:small-conductance mechanosensitive channel